MDGEFWTVIIRIIQNALWMLLDPPRGTHNPDKTQINALIRIEKQLHTIIEKLNDPQKKLK